MNTALATGSSSGPGRAAAVTGSCHLPGRPLRRTVGADLAEHVHRGLAIEVAPLVRAALTTRVA